MIHVEKIEKTEKQEKGQPMKLEFLNEIRTVDTIEMVREIEVGFFDKTGGEYWLTYGSDERIIKLVKEMLDELEWYEILDEAFAQNPLGLYPYNPWCDAGTDERYFTEILLEYHIALNDSGVIEFSNSKESPLYEFFLKNSDGYGKNISVAINGVLHAMRYIIAANFMDTQFAERYMR